MASWNVKKPDANHSPFGHIGRSSLRLPTGSAGPGARDELLRAFVPRHRSGSQCPRLVDLDSPTRGLVRSYHVRYLLRNLLSKADDLLGRNVDYLGLLFDRRC